jgi:2-phospho-L-lactate guanylyltransferase (CobY/MobA/RfbA family)
MKSSFPFLMASRQLGIDYGLVLKTAESLDLNTDAELEATRQHGEGVALRWIATLVLLERQRRRECESTSIPRS